MQNTMWQNGLVSYERRFRWAAPQSQDILFAAFGTVLIGEGEVLDASNAQWVERGVQREGRKLVEGITNVYIR